MRPPSDLWDELCYDGGLTPRLVAAWTTEGLMDVAEHAIRPETRDFVFRRLRELQVTDPQLSLRRIAERMGVSHSTLSKMLNRTRGAKWGTLEKLAQSLEVPVEELVAPGDAGASTVAVIPGAAGDVIRGDQAGEAARFLSGAPQPVPVLDNVRMGSIASGDGGAGSNVSAFPRVPAQVAAGRVLRAVEVGDESMLPELRPGDVVIVDAFAMPQDGDVVAATLLESGDLVVKHYFRQGGQIELVSNVGQPVVVEANEVRVEGVALQLNRKLERRSGLRVVK